MRLSYSNVTSSIALVLAVGGGTAVAAGQLAPDSVGAREIKRAAVRSSEIRNGAVGLADLSRSARPPSRARIASVVTDTMTSADVLAALSGAVKGDRGTPGAAGAQGAQGERGAQGEPGVAGVVTREASAPAESGGAFTATARCEAGETALSGGGKLDRDGGVVNVTAPAADGQGWTVTVTNQSGEQAQVRAFVICAKVGA